MSATLPKRLEEIEEVQNVDDRVAIDVWITERAAGSRSIRALLEITQEVHEVGDVVGLAHAVRNVDGERVVGEVPDDDDVVWRDQCNPAPLCTPVDAPVVADPEESPKPVGMKPLAPGLVNCPYKYCPHK